MGAGGGYALQRVELLADRGNEGINARRRRDDRTARGLGVRQLADETAETDYVRQLSIALFCRLFSERLRAVSARTLERCRDGADLRFGERLFLQQLSRALFEVARFR